MTQINTKRPRRTSPQSTTQHTTHDTMPPRKPFCTMPNWADLVLNELPDWCCVLSLPPYPRILYSSPSVANHLGFTQHDLVGRQLVDLLHADDVEVFCKEMEASAEKSYPSALEALSQSNHNDATTTRQGQRHGQGQQGRSGAPKDGSVATDNADAVGGIFPRDVQLDTCSPFRVYGRFRRKDGRLILLEVNGRPYFSELDTSRADGRDEREAKRIEDAEKNGDAGEVPKPSCFYVMARVYPGRTGALLDSFLELKHENQFLRRRLKELAAESEGDAQRQPQQGKRGSVEERREGRRPSTTAAGKHRSDGPPSVAVAAARALGEVAPDHAAVGDVTPFTQNVGVDGDVSNDVDSFDPNLSIPDQVARLPQALAAADSTSSSEDEGESDEIEADASLSAPVTATEEGGPTEGKNKKRKLLSISTKSLGAAEHSSFSPAKKSDPTSETTSICVDCGTVDSPEWRKGPLGPKSLCNACGLRWAKKSKKASTANVASTSASSSSSATPITPTS